VHSVQIIVHFILVLKISESETKIKIDIPGLTIPNIKTRVLLRLEFICQAVGLVF